MRHRRATKKLNRNTANRKALLRGLVSHLFMYERITTTHQKAKEASILADRLITLGKKKTNSSRRTALSILGSKVLINKLFDDISPRFTTRNGGYTRVMQLGHRKGDGAKMALLELTERKILDEKKKKPAKSSDKTEKVSSQQETDTKQIKKEDSKQKPLAEEKKKTQIPTIPSATREKLEEKEKEKAKSEKEKLQKGFFKGLRRYFRGRSA